jgi:hypothetical protein
MFALFSTTSCLSASSTLPDWNCTKPSRRFPNASNNHPTPNSSVRTVDAVEFGADWARGNFVRFLDTPYSYGSVQDFANKTFLEYSCLD